MPTMHSAIFDRYRKALKAQPLSAVWRGYGSTIFLEFGDLRPGVRRDGSARNSKGDYTVMIEWSWRVEEEHAILCGSWSDEQGWQEVFKSLVGRRVENIALHGRLPELSVALSGGIHIASFMTAEGQPAWTIFNDASHFISVENGKVVEGIATE